MKIEILKVEQNDDGTSTIEFDYDEEYKEEVLKKLGKKTISEEEMSSFVLAEIQKAIHHFTNQEK